MTYKVFLFVLCFSLSGCLMTRNDIEEAERKKAFEQQFSTLQKNTAESQSKYSEVNEEIRALNGRIEVLENRIALLKRENDKLQATHEHQLSDAGKKILFLQEEMQKLGNQTAFLNQELMKINTASQRSEAAPKAAKREDIFLIAEELLKKKEWDKAILQYQKYRETFPKGKKYSEATFKIGHSFHQLGLKEDAKTFYEEVIAKFPNTTFAKEARERLKKIK